MIPEKTALACLIAAVISLFETPVEGFPVRQIKSNPSASARAMFFFVAKRPVAIVVSCSICSAQSSTGSRLTPIGRPVKHCKKRMGSSVVGNPLIAPFSQSNRFSKIKSAPNAATNSALVIPLDIGSIWTSFSATIVRPALPRILSNSWSLSNDLKSAAVQFNNRFVSIYSSLSEPSSLANVRLSSILKNG